MPAFSVVVPVYNGEKTLITCLESLRKQTYTDFEVLMVENGSADDSGRICREYAQGDSRFHLITSKENRGPSGARNLGLEQARGEYVAFVDCDDFVEPDFLEAIHSGFSGQAQAVFFGYRELDGQGNLLGEYLPEKTAGYFETLVKLSEGDMFGYTWIKAFRRDAIGEHRFPMELNLFEDEVFACSVLKECSRVAVVRKPLYNYITGNPGSLVGRTHGDFYSKRDRVFRAWKELLADYENKDAVLEKKANDAVVSCRYYGFERDVDPMAFFKGLSQCEFFKESTGNDPFSVNIRKGKFGRVLLQRRLYRMKVAAAKLLRK